MGVALITANIDGAVQLACKWASVQKLRISKTPAAPHARADQNISTLTRLKASSSGIVAEWNLSESLNGVRVGLLVRPQWYVTVAVYGLMALASGLIIWALLRPLSGFWLLARLFAAGALALWLFFWTRLYDSKLPRLERSFWESAEGKYKVEFLTSVGGRIAGKSGELWAGIVGVVITVCLGGVYGLFGVALALLLTGPTLYTLWLKAKFWEQTEWHWKLLVLTNISKWRVVWFPTLATLVILMTMENFMIILGDIDYNRRPHSNNSSFSYSFLDFFQLGNFREVANANTGDLEKDAKSRLEQFGEAVVFHARKEGIYGRSPQKEAKRFPAVYLTLQVISILAIYASIGTGLLRTARLWRQEIGEQDWKKGPHVPPIRGAWKWRHGWFSVGVLAFYFFGGGLNLIAGAFALEGLSYLIKGETLLTLKSAHLWSWIFASSDILFGDKLGRAVVCLVVVLITAPFILFCSILIRRIARLMVDCTKVLLGRAGLGAKLPSRLSSLDMFVDNACFKKSMRRPVIHLIHTRDVIARVRWLPVATGGLLELSHGAIDLLEPEELKATVAHELGHLEQGIFRIALLKALSLLVLFPNYCLTSCINWSAKEVEADEFALELTDNPAMLRCALLKISTVEVLGRGKTVDTVEMRKFATWWRDKARNALEEARVAARFFLGNGILGYTHPFLSERLAAVSAFENSESPYRLKEKKLVERG